MKTKTITHLAVLGFFILTLGACGGVLYPAVDETGDETANVIGGVDRSPAADVQTRTVSLNQTTNVRKLVKGVLELAVEIPPGSVILIPATYEISQIDYRNSSGGIERSSTGFVGKVKLVSTPDGSLSKSALNQHNSTVGGLFVSASVATAIEGTAGNFKAIAGAAPQSDYLTKFETSGKAKFNYTASLTKKFGARLNKPVDPKTLSDADRIKFQKVFAELVRAADRKVETPKSILMIDKSLADKLSKAYESDGSVALNGAWTIAVQATAVRHGFENVPCAEFQSELLRQAYQRAGYSVANDFNAAKSNQLIWSKTASVVGFAKALYDAGWIPYEPSKFRPPTGAFVMNAAGGSPGHAYTAAGDDGRLIIDNGSPQGRDLRATTAKTIGIMYEGGVFFLPPGLTPKSW